MNNQIKILYGVIAILIVFLIMSHDVITFTTIDTNLVIGFNNPFGDIKME